MNTTDAFVQPQHEHRDCIYIMSVLHRNIHLNVEKKFRLKLTTLECPFHPRQNPIKPFWP